MSPPAVVLSSHTIGLYIIRCLGTMGVPLFVFYYNKNDMGYVSKFVTQRIHTPHPEKNESEFVDLLLTYGKRLKRGVLFAADDPTLKIVSKNKAALSKYYTLTCPDWEITEKFIDKKYTYELAESLGLPTPKSLIPKSPQEVKRISKELNYPCIVKPCQSHLYFEVFRKKMVKVYNSSQLLAAYRQANEIGLEIMLQEFIPGSDIQGVNYNSYFFDGQPKLEFTAQKCRLAPPEFGIPRVVKSIYIPEIIEPGRKILQALGFNGYSCTEFKKDSRDGLYKFMEVNARHNRSGLLALKCGINFPYIEYRHKAEGFLQRTNHSKTNIYWIDEVQDIFSSLRHFKKEKYTIHEYLRPYFGVNIFAVFSINDLKPILKRLYDVLCMFFESVYHKFTKMFNNN
jgi:predicted ATP-grasp superfamily ATP-dependent carboligase